MTYTELLQKEEWTDKCNTILQRDKYTCHDCGCKGYHNDTFMTFNSLEEVNKYFGKDFFEGESLAELKQRFTTQLFIEHLNDIKTYIRRTVETKNIYDLGIFGHLTQPWHKYLGSAPTGFRLVTEHNFDIINLNMKCISKSVKRTNYSVVCRAYLLEFSEKIANKVYVSIEHKTLMMIDGVPIFDDILCISYDNKMIYLDHHFKQGLNIHHNFYVHGLKPWEYKDEVLVTLCESCHQKRHEKPTPCYRSLNFGEPIEYYNTCYRCSGSGYLPQYNHVQNGVCFKCGGEGVLVRKTSEL